MFGAKIRFRRAIETYFSPIVRDSFHSFSDRHSRPTAIGNPSRGARLYPLEKQGNTCLSRLTAEGGRSGRRREGLPKDKKRRDAHISRKRYYKPFPLLYPPRSRRCASYSRDSPWQLAILFGLPFDADYQMRSSDALSLSRPSARILEDFAIPPPPPPRHPHVSIRARAEGAPTVYPLAVPRKKRGNHFGILSGITSGTRRGQRGLGAKRSE